MKATVFIESKSTDPGFNLALEQYVFEELPKDREYFMLWQNANTIVVGKHQNTMEEINLPYVRDHGIRVVRRLSGGGAVYHDLGNVNFTLIADAGDIERINLQAFCIPVVQTLRKIGVLAETSGRNDITIAGKKFSGNSQYVKNGRIMHHGCMMFDSDLTVVGKALAVSADKYESKGFKSVSSRVTNISEYLPWPITIEQFKELLKQNMIAGNDVTEYELTRKDLDRIYKIKRERYDTWEWNYGSSPAFRVRKKRKVEGCGTIEVFLDIEDGKIVQFESFGDYFGNGRTEELAQRLRGCSLKEKELKARLNGFALESCYHHLSEEAFIAILTL